MLAVALTGSAVVPAVSSAGGPSFKTGRYQGKTSQGQTIKFSIVKSTCDSPRPPYAFHKAYCFKGLISNPKLQAYYPTVLEPCSDHTTYKDPLYVASYKLSLSGGKLSYSERGLGSTLEPGGSISSIKLAVRGSKATGTLHQTESYDTGNGDVYCDSKTVSFTARLR
jgi:hypothetical protein